MDANGLRFWMLADDAHWPGREHAAYDRACRSLRLAPERTLQIPDTAGTLSAAGSALERVPLARDPHGALARWDATRRAIVTRSHLPGEATLLVLGSAATVSDLAVGYDGVLYIALDGGVLLHDLRGRWADTQVGADGFSAWRLAPDPHGGAWVLDRQHKRLGRVRGLPFPERPYAEYAPGTFRPDPENPSPPTLEIMESVTWPADESPVALACAPDGALALLGWPNGGDAVVRLLAPGGESLAPAQTLDGARYPHAVAWVAPDRIAVLLAGLGEAPTFVLAPETQSLPPAGDYFPLRDAEPAPFVHTLELPPHYATAGRGSAALHRLSLPFHARTGEARNFAGTRMHLLDGENARTVWHRLCVEARLPPRTGFIVWLAATNEPAPPAPDDAEAWHEHRFGEAIPRPAGPHAPRAVWLREASEIPHHPGLAPWPREPDRAGLFTVLIQRARQRVRTLRGRYLWVRVQLFGDGRATPDIAALRAYGSRFSYVEHYLPRLYRESVFGEAADAPGELVTTLALNQDAALDAGGNLPVPVRERLAGEGVALSGVAQVTVERASASWLVRDAVSSLALRVRREAHALGIYRARATPADFLERFLGNVEGVLTAIEDRIAAAHVLTHPDSVPEESLEWLAGWIGVAFDPAYPPLQRRALLAAAPVLFRERGTLRGLQRALDIATDGGVSGGEILVIEDYRLRRTFATVLGADLADERDPLLPGLAVSGNSIVGDTLILGEEHRREFMALFGADVETSAAEDAAIQALYDKLAFRASVLVHNEVEPQDLGLIRRVVELETPAHVQARVLTASWPFLVGIAALVGVDTYLATKPRKAPARVGRSALGVRDYVLGVGSLDPRLSGGHSVTPAGNAPVADAGPDRSVPHGESFELDGSGSRAAPGRTLTRYRWEQLD